MLRKIDHKKMGRSNLGWLNTHFHFSFAEYYNPKNINFGELRVVNDDLIESGYGFGAHGHNDMEVISYVINGELTHNDSLGNGSTLKRGDVQYMSAGTGIVHSEYNLGKDLCRLLQIWITPDKEGHAPNYGDYQFNWNDRVNKFMHIVSNKSGVAPIKINQDVNIYVAEIEKDQEMRFTINKTRQAYLVQIEGESVINNVELSTRDALEIIEENIIIKPMTKSHFIIIEMEKK